MARILVNKEGMENLKSRLYSISNRVNGLENNIAHSLNSLDWEVSQKELVRGRILEARKKASALAEQSNQMRIFVERAIHDFSSTDGRIAGKQKESLSLLDSIWKGLVYNFSRIYNGLSQQSIKLIESIRKVSEFFINRDYSIKMTNISEIKKGLGITAIILGGITPFVVSELLKRRFQIMPHPGKGTIPKKTPENIPPQSNNQNSKLTAQKPETKEGNASHKEYAGDIPDIYKEAIRKLQEKHPNWTFEFYETDVTWQQLINAEDKGERNLIHTSTPKSYREEDPGNKDNWSPPVRKVIEYYADPRNFMDEKNIFQFQYLGYKEGRETLEGVKGILEGTVHTKYADTIMEAAKESGVSAYHLASKLRAEAGTDGNPLSEGTVANHKNCYNFFNISASGKSDEQVLKNGAIYAQKHGWDTPEKAILGGAKFIAKDYIGKGQDTLYTQKFDIVGPSYFDHQYMQNIAVAKLEAPKYYSAYKDANALDSELLFRIPVYKGIPSTKASLPE